MDTRDWIGYIALVLILIGGALGLSYIDGYKNGVDVSHKIIENSIQVDVYNLLIKYREQTGATSEGVYQSDKQQEEGLETIIQMLEVLEDANL